MIYIMCIYDICNSKYIKYILYLYCSSKQSYIHIMKIILEIPEVVLKEAAIQAAQQDTSRKKLIEQIVIKHFTTAGPKKGGKNA